MQMSGQAVGRYHIEAAAGHQHDASIARHVIKGGQGLEDIDLTGDIQIMRLGTHTGMCQWLAGVNEGAGAVEHYGYPFQITGYVLRIIQREATPAQAVFRRQGCQFGRTAASNDGL
jgi:hypothetical protein